MTASAYGIAQATKNEQACVFIIFLQSNLKPSKWMVSTGIPSNLWILPSLGFISERFEMYMVSSIDTVSHYISRTCSFVCSADSDVLHLRRGLLQLGHRRLRGLVEQLRHPRDAGREACVAMRQWFLKTL